MKKTILISVISTVIASSLFLVATAERYTKFSSKFVKNFKDCDRYEETVKSEFEAQSFTTNRKIIGWRNGFCLYEEVITSPKDQYKLSCRLTSFQVDELYNAMKTRSRKAESAEMEIFAPQETKDGSTKYTVIGTETIKGNKAYLSCAKIQNNPYFCRPVKTK